MTKALINIDQMLSNDNELSKLVPFRVQPKGKYDKARLELLMQYQGPDEDTLSLLRDNHHRWLQNPSSFWICPELVMAGVSDPQAEIVSRYLQHDRDNA